MKYLMPFILFVILPFCAFAKPIKVADGLYRGERPRSFSSLQHLNIKHVINLQSGVYETFSDTPYEHEQAEDFNKIKLEEKFGTVNAPTIHELYEVARKIERFRHQGGVYVHCLHGKDRTGMAIAAWRIIYDDWTVDKAIKEMDNHGFHNWSYSQWKKQLYKLRK